MSEMVNRVATLIDGHTERREERELLKLLQSASAGELNEVLTGVDVGELVASVDAHLLGGDNSQGLLDLLTRDRLADLTLAARGAVVAGLQKGRTSDSEEDAAVRIMTSESGRELTELKNAVNLARGRHDLEGLIFDDIDDEGRREIILKHFADHADALGRGENKVISDIDDTAIARIHERRYPKGSVIPGLLALYEALDLGPRDEPVSRGDLTFVTARPSDALGLVKGQSRKALTNAGVRDLSIMTGSVFNLATKDGMATKKLENIDHYARMFPEYNLVFIGDSGQGDIVVGQKMVQVHGDVVAAVFIHDVVNMSEQERAELAEQRVIVVDTYAGAAVHAYELGLISATGVRSVVDACREDLDALTWDSPEQEAATRALHERDAAAALALVS